MSRNLQFKEGDLVEVLENYRVHGRGNYPWGPTIHEAHQWRALEARDLTPGGVFLVLSDVKEAGWRQNRRLWTHVMTSGGPRSVWAGAFKMRKKE